METSFFTDKSATPTEDDLKSALGDTVTFWKAIKINVYEKYPAAKEEWNYSGTKYGWNFRLKDKKRAIIYFLPRDGYFKVAFVFGQKATDHIIHSTISDSIKNDLLSAKVYAEGRGIRIDIKNEENIKDVLQLIEIKLKF